MRDCVLQFHAALLANCSLGFNSRPTELLILLEPTTLHRLDWNHHKMHNDYVEGGKS